MNQKTYINNGFPILNSSQFVQLNHDATDKFAKKKKQKTKKNKELLKN